MFYHYLSFLILIIAVCSAVSTYFLLRHPRLVEKYARLLRSLNWTAHTTFAVTFGLLAALELYDRFWFGAAMFGAASAVYAYFAVERRNNPPSKAGEAA